jgi:DNA-binding winged helix-turn-helix (wHTH) protein
MPGCVHFGQFELDVAAFTLRRNGASVRLEKIPMEVLVLLVENAGALVDRSRIHAALWGPNVFVDRDAAINTAMRKIRRALDEDADRPRFVETVVGKGYRFVAPLERGRAGTQRQLPKYRLMRGKHAFTLEDGDNLLGRDPDVHVHLDHASVSRRHARISVSPDRVVLEDLSSRNGTFVNGQGITLPTELRDGAVIGLGPITLTFVAPSGPASTRPMNGSPDSPDADPHSRP